MRYLFRNILLTALLVVSFFSIAMAQSSLSVSGSFHRYNPHGAAPYPAVGYQVYLYTNSMGWIGPVYTDSWGRYAFYNLSSGQYLMRVYALGNQVWQQQLNVPCRVNPIILR